MAAVPDHPIFYTSHKLPPRCLNQKTVDIWLLLIVRHERPRPGGVAFGQLLPAPEMSTPARIFPVHQVIATGPLMNHFAGPGNP